jgi:DnaJ-domain-containing protein 1
MTLVYGLLFAAALLIGLAWLFARMKTQKAAQSLRVVLGLLGLILGAALTLRGMGVAGVPLATAALGLLAVALRGGPRAGTRGYAPPPSASTTMSRKEAASILGVGEDASEDEIRTAHRDLMKKVHPDAGGNDALAAKVQEARDTLLGE